MRISHIYHTRLAHSFFLTSAVHMNVGWRYHTLRDSYYHVVLQRNRYVVLWVSEVMRNFERIKKQTSKIKT